MCAESATRFSPRPRKPRKYTRRDLARRLRLQNGMAHTPPYIAGIHFFCDHRCWRCPMTHRCRVWARVADGPGSRPPEGGGPMARVAAVTMAAMHVTVDEVSEIVEALASGALADSDASADLTVSSA